jgi:hypothetical protein
MKKIIKTSIGSLVVLVLSLPATGLAAVFPGQWDWSKSIVPCGPGLPKPSCDSICDLFPLAQNLISFGITIVIEILAPIAIVIGAFYIITAGDSPDRLKTGKNAIIYAAIGIIIALGSFIIINTFLWLLGKTTLNPNTSSWAVFSCSAIK